MEMMTDIRDWLGGYPMEFSRVEEVVDVVHSNSNLRLGRLRTGEGNTEYLFFNEAQGARFHISAPYNDASLEDEFLFICAGANGTDADMDTGKLAIYIHGFVEPSDL